MSDKRFVSYEEFGAVGDGKANDFEAIYRAHEYANANGFDVKADSAKTYRISDTRIDGTVATVKIRTNVDWGDANFIIDDSELHGWDGTGMAPQNIFEVVSDYEALVIKDEDVLLKLAGLSPETKKVNLGLGYPAMIIPYNDEYRVYRRRGAHYANAGAATHEVLVIDAEGNIDSDTPVMFSYEKLTSLLIFRTDMPRITVEGGTFTTDAPRDNVFAYDSNGKYVIKECYFGRGLLVTRSYTIVKNVKHYVINEVSIKEQLESNFRYGGAQYSGFFYAKNATDVTFENCVLTGRRCYMTPEGLTNYCGTMGTYDFGANAVNKIRLVGCDQCNFFVNKNTAEACDENDPDAVLSMDFIPGTWAKICWGIGGTNFCKNMEYINSRLSRFDAHAGLYHGKVIGSIVNAISIVGNGNMIIENTRMISGGKGHVNNSFLYMRDDYGATWEGDILIKDCSAETDEEFLYMANISWANWFYGYKCYMPSMTIDNFTFKAKPGTRLEILRHHDIEAEPKLHLAVLSNGDKNDNPFTPPKYLRIINNKTNQEYHLIDSPAFENTELVGNIIRN